MAYPWVKLYTEMIHDPKLGRLSEHLQLVFVKLMCVTGEHDAERTGALPPVDEMAWTLRMDEAQLEADLEALARAGMVHCTDGAWLVTNFAARQGAAKIGERVAAFRERKHKAEYYEPADETQAQQACNDDVTEMKRVVTQTRLDKTRLDEEVEVDQSVTMTTTTTTTLVDPLVVAFYDGLKRLGAIVTSQAQSDAYRAIVDDIRGVADPPAFMAQLFAEAASSTSGRVTPRWFEAVVDRCIREGRMPGDKRANGNGRDRPGATVSDPDTEARKWADVAKQWPVTGVTQ